MPRATSPRPLYRQILREALTLAWKDKRFWPLALFTAFLQTAGIYDVFFLAVSNATRAPLAQDQSWHGFFAWVQQLGVIDRFALTQSIIFALVLIGVILFLSIIAQGSLVASLDRGQAAQKQTFRSMLQTAARRVVPLVVVNALVSLITSLGSIGLSSVASLVPGTSWGAWLFVAVCFVYLVLLFVVTSLHLFTLNGMMADGMTLHEALNHAISLFRRAWLTIAEAALCMALIGAGILGLAFAGAFLAGIPLIGFLYASLYLTLPKIFVFANILLAAIVFLAAVFGGLFAITFQYATWNRLYRRAVEGTAHSKIIRVVHSLTSRASRSSSAR